MFVKMMLLIRLMALIVSVCDIDNMF